MKILVTGAAGYLGRGMVASFAGHADLRLMDVVDFDTPHEKVVGDVTDFAAVRRAVEGVDALIIAHMAPTTMQHAGWYETPSAAYPANVTGTANLLFAAAAERVPRVALISSIGAVHHWVKKGVFLNAELPLRGAGIYSYTKICQEVIAQQAHYEHGLPVAVIRAGFLRDMDTCSDRFGRPMRDSNWMIVDRRDVGEVARLALSLPDLGYEVFWALGTPMATEHADMEPTYRRLNWRPRYDFSNLPRHAA